MKFFSTILARLRSAAHPDPVRDWLGLLTLSLLVFVSIVVWNIWAFGTVAQGGVIGTNATSTPPVFSSSSLDAIHSVFLMRADEHAKYATGVYRYTDPSQ
ncbi:MAG: hypothetical protein Q7R59_01995 [bacterium]|nr:hypothetical protein [bacterium]